MTGNDEPVSSYVMSFEESRTFLKKLVDMLEFLIPHYIKEGKNSLVISIGCTGGKHRSVTLTNALYNALGKDGHTLLLKHNDIEKGQQTQEISKKQKGGAKFVNFRLRLRVSCPFILEMEDIVKICGNCSVC